MSEPFVVGDDDFAEKVLDSELPVLVDFWAEWCGPCHMIAPHVKAIAAEHSSALSVAKMDVDENPATPGRYGVSGIPTLMLFKGGDVVARIVGAQPKERILAQIAPHVSLKGA